MKEIIAIIRMNKMNQTKTTLADNGIASMTAWAVKGRGRGLINKMLLEGASAGHEEAINQLGSAPKFYPKRLLSIVVPDAKVKTVVDLIIQVNQTGSAGDGKILVLPCLDAVRVRTGESGDEALSEATVIPANAEAKESAA